MAPDTIVVAEKEINTLNLEEKNILRLKWTISMGNYLKSVICSFDVIYVKRYHHLKLSFLKLEESKRMKNNI